MDANNSSIKSPDITTNNCISSSTFSASSCSLTGRSPWLNESISNTHCCFEAPESRLHNSTRSGINISGRSGKGSLISCTSDGTPYGCTFRTCASRCDQNTSSTHCGQGGSGTSGKFPASKLSSSNLTVVKGTLTTVS